MSECEWSYKLEIEVKYVGAIVPFDLLAGRSPIDHTRQWRVIYGLFETEESTASFQRNLKSDSGKSYTTEHRTHCRVCSTDH